MNMHITSDSFRPLYKYLPSLVTLTGLCLGLSAIQAAFQGRWEQGVMLIVLAVICDGLDGYVARYFKASSEFGAQLDSLSDLVCFGVAPALLLYLWSQQYSSSLAWGMVLLFVVCCMLRLARFNTALTSRSTDSPLPYFIGLASPVSALLVLAPMMLSFAWPGAAWLAHPLLLTGALAGIGFLMVSRVPTFSIKHLSLHSPPMRYLLGLALIWALAMSLVFWLTLAVTVLAYLLSVPFSLLLFARPQASADFSEA
jgi:CDP-diacylglycerol--serine O-phosphatidyltransferase